MLRKIVYIAFCTLLIASKAQSAIRDYRTLTWNMQGSCSNDNSPNQNKWVVVRRNFLDYDFLALQEAGALSSLPGSNPIPFSNIDNPDSVSNSLSIHQWNLGTNSRPEFRYIYFLETDTGGNRVNLAIVTRLQADQVILLQPDRSFRPILGIRYRSNYVFNIHAASMGSRNNNAPNLINRVYNYMQTRGSDSWIVMGDFNRSPDSLMNSLQSRYPVVALSVMTVNQRHATQRSGGNLDYAVVPNNNNGLTARRGLTHSPSDHQQVFFFNPNSMCHF
jgi:cytolethal distending toxin subunit B